jgi:hypothetical protein
MKADSGVNQAGRTRVSNQTAAPHLCQSAPVLRGSSPFVVSGQGRGRKGNRKDRGPRMSRSTTGRHGQAAARHDGHEASGIMWLGRVGGSKPSSIAAFVKRQQRDFSGRTRLLLRDGRRMRPPRGVLGRMNLTNKEGCTVGRATGSAVSQVKGHLPKKRRAR